MIQVEANSTGIVTRGLLNRLIEQANSPEVIYLNPDTKLASDLSGVKVYNDLLVILTSKCPVDSVLIE